MRTIGHQMSWYFKKRPVSGQTQKDVADLISLRILDTHSLDITQKRYTITIVDVGDSLGVASANLADRCVGVGSNPAAGLFRLMLLL